MNQFTSEKLKGDNLEMDARGAVFMTLEVRNSATDTSKLIKFLIDSGFNGFLQLAGSEAEELGLGVQSHGITIVSDGRSANLDITTATIRMLGEDIGDVLIQVEEKGLALIGTALLKRANLLLTLDYEDGFATITRDADVKESVKEAVKKGNAGQS